MRHERSDILAIITARGGSKGVPKKNIRLLDGKPLIAHTIEAATRSRFLTRVVISTDSEEIADVAAHYGAEKLFLRPARYSLDSSPSWEAVLHAVEWIRENEGRTYPLVCLLQPTSPFRTSRHIDEAIEKFHSLDGVDSVVSVCASAKSPYWSQRISAEGYLRPVIASPREYTRRQDAPKTYELNGAVYIAATAYFERAKSFMGDRTSFYEMDDMSSLDVDTELDFLLAETICSRRHHDE